MIITSITALFILPFMAEWFAVNTGEDPKDVAPKKVWTFYLLVPLMGAIVYGSGLAITGRPFLSLVWSMLFYGGLTAVSNKKLEILRSPFNAHDFDNLRNLYIYPEFYVSYVGWPLFSCVMGTFFSLIGLALWLEPPVIYSVFPAYFSWFISVGLWISLIWIGRKLTYLFFREEIASRFGVRFSVQDDIARFGLFPTILFYRLFLKEPCKKSNLQNRHVTATPTSPSVADIIAIQGESYFDLRRLFSLTPTAGSTASWQPLEALEARGVRTGNMIVPAWGAYTMQTEFSFLSGIENSLLGIDRINPYMRFSQVPINTSVAALKKQGYRTICIHPAKKEFFRRSDVMYNLGFDEFIGLEAFPSAPLFGKYISDSALTEKINTIIEAHHKESSQPLFLFAITIESHGPWATGRLAAHLDEATLVANNQTGDHSFALYQQHMENLLALYKDLSVDSKSTKPRVVTMYGDHMPALGDLFDTLHFNEKPVDYLLWRSDQNLDAHGTQKIETFAHTVLKAAGLHLTIK